MNSAIHSTLSSGRPSIIRRSKAYRRKIFARLLLGLPVVASLGWEYRVWKRNLYYERNREHFPGSTPFYGKLWGYESDYMIETSLSDGDIVFWSADPLSIHIHEAILRFPYRHLKGDYDSWDFCGLVKKTNGRAYVVGADGVPVLYSDLVADYRTTTLAVRKMVDTSGGGECRHRIAAKLQVDSRSSERYIRLHPLGCSARTLLNRYFQNSPFLRSFFESWNGATSQQFPVDILSGDHAKLNDPIYEISDVFLDPLTFDSISYSPPFFVRRVDNEYYNHNRTKNVIVDWELLVQRDERNKMVSKHQQNS